MLQISNPSSPLTHTNMLDVGPQCFPVSSVTRPDRGCIHHSPTHTAALAGYLLPHTPPVITYTNVPAAFLLCQASPSCSWDQPTHLTSSAPRASASVCLVCPSAYARGRYLNSIRMAPWLLGQTLGVVGVVSVVCRKDAPALPARGRG
jgi:hypothetical protein